MVLALRMFGGSWEQWENELTMDRMCAMGRSLDDVPLVDWSAFAIVRALGGGVPLKGAQSGKKQEATLGVAEFIAMMGGGKTAELRGSL